jgi:hypothetical protein
MTTITTSPRMSVAAILASTMGALGHALPSPRLRDPQQQRKPAPMMVTSSAEEIAAWNRKVDDLNNLHFHRHEFKKIALYRGTGQHPKFPKARVHKQAKHPQRDEHGAYTLVGRGELPNGITDGRRMWLAGISAQRGY